MNYRARWINNAGVETRDDYFKYNPSSHEMWGLTREDTREISLSLDSPYFNASDIRAFIGGYFDRAIIPDKMVIVDDEGILKDYEMQMHPDVREFSKVYGYDLYGACILVEVVR